MLESFNRKELEAIDRLMRDPDFILFIQYIVRNGTNLALSACQVVGVESEKIKGGSVCLQELRDGITFSRDVLKRFKEQEELPDLGRDTISP